MKNLTSYLLAAALFASPALLVQAAEQQPADGQQPALAQQDQQNAPNTLNPPQTPLPPSEQGDSNQPEGMGNSDESTGQALDESTGQASEQSSTVGGQQFIEKATGQQMLASDLIGYSVTNLQNENIGKVDDLILDQDQRPVGIVISAGGFLGLGARHVAIPMSEAHIKPENKIVQVNISKEELNKAPVFKAPNEQNNGQKEESGSDSTSGQ